MKFGQYGSKRREFKSPFGVSVDCEGHIYVADSYNHRIQVNTWTFSRTVWCEYGGLEIEIES